VKVYVGKPRLAERIACVIAAVTKNGLDRYTREATCRESSDGVAVFRRTLGSSASNTAPKGERAKSRMMANCCSMLSE
jgi:hypothetical protein